MRWSLTKSRFRAVEIAALVDIMSEAKSRKLSGKGRPEWVQANAGSIRQIVLGVVLEEHSPEKCYRCHALVLSNDHSVARFMVDVLPGRFRSLRRLRLDEVETLLAHLVRSMPSVPFDSDQVRPW